MTTVTPAEHLEVPVAGGAQHVGRWGGTGPVVLAVHGITATHAAWTAVAQQAPRVTLLAPDLRGRGRSAHLPGPYGLDAHVADLAALLDAQRRGGDQRGDRVLVVGHSMGAFVAVAFAARHPDRVSRLVLVDGGLPLGRPADPAPEGGIDALLGPAAARLARTFPTVAAYREFWRTHPAFGPMWGPAVEAYVDDDLVGEPPHLHSSCCPEAVRADGADVHDHAAAAAALRDVVAPMTFLRAERGLLNERPPLYPSDALTRWLRAFPAIRCTTVPDTNHYSILLGTAGSAVVARAINEALAAAAAAR